MRCRRPPSWLLRTATSIMRQGPRYTVCSIQGRATEPRPASGLRPLGNIGKGPFRIPELSESRQYAVVLIARKRPGILMLSSCRRTHLRTSRQSHLRHEPRFYRGLRSWYLCTIRHICSTRSLSIAMRSMTSTSGVRLTGPHPALDPSRLDVEFSCIQLPLHDLTSNHDHLPFPRTQRCNPRRVPLHLLV